MEGESRLTTLTLPIDPAKATQAAKKGSTTKPSESGGSGFRGRPTNRTSLTYTESNVPLTFVKSPVNYFYARYLPVLLAVLFTMLAGYLYTATKMMEPFAMLSKSSQGIPAKDFLWINYLSANDSIEPFTALTEGHWLMLWVSVLYIAAQLLSPLTSEMFGIYPGYKKIDEYTVTAGACKFIPLYPKNIF